MEPNELAKKMLEWGEKKAALDALAAENEAEVLKIGKTQTVGNVRCTFCNGRKSTDYEAICNDHGIPPIEILKYDYTAAAKHAIENNPEIDLSSYITQGQPSATLKIV